MPSRLVESSIDEKNKSVIKGPMKTLILALILATFAIASQADEAKPAKKTTKDNAACCASAKTTVQVKATKSKDDCAGQKCCKEKQQVKLMSPKAAAEMGR
jgi:hypothetical protein